MVIEEKEFGTYSDGTKVKLYTITNRNGMSISVTDLGAALVKALVPDKNGVAADVVLGFDKGSDYMSNSSFFGVVIGPNANRVGGAAFTLDGVTYQLDENDGANNLHSHKEKGWHKRLWQAEMDDNSVTFFLEDSRFLLYPGDCIHIRSQQRHNWMNRTNRTARILTINTPNPLPNP